MNFQPHLALSAAAGSGKTFALSVRYISLLFMGESPSSILAATFTKKATAEMHERVIVSLRHLDEDEAFLAAVLEQTGFSLKRIYMQKSSKKYTMTQVPFEYTLNEVATMLNI